MGPTVPVMLALSLVLIGRASASPSLGPGSSWGEIRLTPNVIARPPLVFFGTTGIPVTDVCIVGDRFRAVNHDGVTSEVPRGTQWLSYEIEVDESFGSGERSNFRRLFTKHYEIPNCS